MSTQSNGSVFSDDQRRTLLGRAAKCYRQADLDGDAARCYRESGIPSAAAILYEKVGLPLDAAECYVQAGQWREAAHCFQTAGQIERAAECLLEAGDDLEAGWPFAHGVHQWNRAMGILTRVDPTDAVIGAALDLARARCQVPRHPIDASRAVVRAIRALVELSGDPGRQRILEWAMAVAEALLRPDLVATLHATAYRIGLPNARRNWERWAITVFGQADGLPPELDEEETPLGERSEKDGGGKTA